MKKNVLLWLLCIISIALVSCRDIADTPKQPNEGNEYVFYLENGLYDIGQYKSNEKYEHFTGEPAYEFTSRDDYGPLLPFSSGQKKYRTKDEYVMGGLTTSFSKYGLCTTDGKVVVEPVYAYINGFTSSDGFKYYILSYENEPQLDEEGNLTNGDDVFMPNRSIIIPSDGSWSLELESGAYVGGVGDGIILVCKNDYKNNKNEFKMYDYDGNFLFSIDSYEHMEAYKDGYAIARIYPEYSHDAKTNPAPGVCVYIDKRGNVALEGYTDGTSFNGHGVASVQIDGGKYALINTDGEPLTEIIYDSLYLTGDDGYFQGFVADINERHIFNEEGELIGNVTQPGTSYVSFIKLKSGEIVYNYYDSRLNGEKWYRLSDNSPIVCKENGMMPNDYTYGDNLFIYKEKGEEDGYNSESSAILFDVDGNTVVKLDRYRYASWIDSDRKLMGYIRSDPDAKPMTDEEEKLYGTQNKDEFVILDTKTGEEICVFKNCYYASFVGKNKNLVSVQIQVRKDGEFETEYSLYDISKKEFVSGFEEFCEFRVTDIGGKEYLTVGKQNSIILYDEDFNVILRKHLDRNV